MVKLGPILLVVTALGTAARAAEPEPERGPNLSIYHLPTASASAGDALSIDARITSEALLESAWIEVRPAIGHTKNPVFDRFEKVCKDAKGAFDAATKGCSLPLQRTKHEMVFSASIPGGFVQPPGIVYLIAARWKDGAADAAFTSREHPYPVVVTGETAASQRADRLARHRGRTSQFALRTDLTMFGSERIEGDEGPTASDGFSDLYGSVEVEYTSRPLTRLYAFRMGLGVMRGQRSTFAGPGGRTQGVGSGPQPGLNYGFGEVDFEVAPYFYVTPRLTLGASEVGFAAGLGLATTIGRPTSTHLEVGVDWVTEIGTKGWLAFRWRTVPGFPMSLTVELTEHPDPDSNALGTRLLYDVGLELGDSFTLDLRAGYAQRANAFDGGFVVGLGGTFDF